jgi:LuxR family quorum-sensing system transcriptional regulator CciR
MLRAAERTACGFRWERIEALVRLSPREKAHRAEAARHGLVEGYTVPSHVPGEAPGSVSFGAAPGRAPDPRALPAAEALGRFAFEAARRLTGVGAEPIVAPYPLSDRQRDCVLLVARGKSDGVIAELLGLGRRTVNEHIEAAKRRYGVATRAQLVVRALLRGEIAFADIADRPPQ